MPKEPACVQECDRMLRQKTEEYQAMFNSTGSVYYRNTNWLQEVLAQARNEYDACIAMCPEMP